MTKRTLTTLSSLSLAFLLVAQSSAQAPPQMTASEQALRGRVEQFYSFLRVGRIVDAEEFTTREMREYFLAQGKGPFINFKITSVKFSPEGSASPETAEVMVEQEIALMEVRKTTTATVKTTWKLVKGVWMLDGPQTKPRGFQDLTNLDPNRPLPPPPPPPELKFDSMRASFQKDLHRGDKGTARFSFKNVSEHPVSLEVKTFCPCLTPKKLKPTYAPGEAGELVIEFDTKEYAEDYLQTIFVTTLPNKVQHSLLLAGYVIRSPKPDPNMDQPKPDVKPKP